jgi:hypothetical protein
MTAPDVAGIYRLVTVERGRFSQSLRQVERDGLVPVYRAMTAYFRRQISLGVVRPLEPSLLARRFLMTIAAEVSDRWLSARSWPPASDRFEPFLASVVEVFLHGVRQEPCKG